MAAWLERQKRRTDDGDVLGKECVLRCIGVTRNVKDENEMETCRLAEKWLDEQNVQKPDISVG